MERLRRRREFEAVLASPLPARVGYCFVVRARARVAGPARLGIIVSGKTLRRAVDRNRAKRMVRGVFRAIHLQLAPADVVIQVRGGWSRSSPRAARAELSTILGQLMQEGQR